MLETEILESEEKIKLQAIVDRLKKRDLSHFHPLGWWPSYADNPEITVPSLLTALKTVREKVRTKKPAILDLGCGNSIMLTLAVLGGFNKAFGIELQQPLVDESTKTISEFEHQAIIPKGKIEIVQGTYYSPALHQRLLPRCKESLLSRFEKDGLLFENKFEDFVKAVLAPTSKTTSVEELITNHLFPPSNSDPYQELDILHNGKLKMDVVFSFPSDIFFESAFLYQLSQTMKSDSLLVIHDNKEAAVNITPEVRKNFTEEKTFPISQISETKMQFRLLRKR